MALKMFCRRFLPLTVLILLGMAPTVFAAWWWPFGDDDKWSRLPRAEQDAAAGPLMQAAQDNLRRGNSSSALDGFKTVAKQYPGSRYAPEALFQTGEIRLRARSWKKSFEAYQNIVELYPNFPQFTEVIARQFDLAISLAEGNNSRYIFLIPYNNYDRAIEYFEKIVANAPYSDYAPLALMNVALIHRYRKDSPEAIDALDRLINNYPSSLLTSNAYLNLADTFGGIVEGPHYDQGATREAINYYQDYLILFPRDPDLARGERGLADMQNVFAGSKFILGEYFYKHRKDYRAAKIFLNEAITVAPKSLVADEARALLAVIDAKVKDLPPPPPPKPITLPKYDNRIWLDRLVFWEKPVAHPGLPGGAATETPAESKKPSKSFFNRLKFWQWGRSGQEAAPTVPPESVAPATSSSVAPMPPSVSTPVPPSPDVSQPDPEPAVSNDFPSPVDKLRQADQAAAHTATQPPSAIESPAAPKRPSKSFFSRLKFWSWGRSDKEGQPTETAPAPTAPVPSSTQPIPSTPAQPAPAEAPAPALRSSQPGVSPVEPVPVKPAQVLTPPTRPAMAPPPAPRPPAPQLQPVAPAPSIEEKPALTQPEVRRRSFWDRLRPFKKSDSTANAATPALTESTSPEDLNQAVDRLRAADAAATPPDQDQNTAPPTRPASRP